ncbi:MAG: hypothetical protein ACKVJR_08290 [Flavobacteriales bacterium]
MTKNENENKIDELIHDYFKQFPKTGFPMELLYTYGEEETVKILKSREGRRIDFIIENKEVIDGGKYIYIDD